MREQVVSRAGRIFRSIHNLSGINLTACMQTKFGKSTARFAREILGKSARHRVQITCKKELIGVGYDSWVVCPDGLTKEAVVYSLGIGDEIEFDLGLIERFGLNVFAFDPSPTAIAWLLRSNFKFIA